MKSFACMWLGSSVVATLSDAGHWNAPLGLQESLNRQFGAVVIDPDGVENPSPLSLDARFAAACERMAGVAMETAPPDVDPDTAVFPSGS